MAKVKVILSPDETEIDVDANLYKALQHQIGGDVHMRESFDDPAMVHASERMQEMHRKIYADMIKEIADALDQDYSDGNF